MHARTPVARTFADDSAVRRGLEEARCRIDPVLAEIRHGNPEADARIFMDTVAMGPGAWAQLPERMPWGSIHNAPTFLHDSEEEERGVVDADELRAISAPVLLTDGGRTPPEFAASRLNVLLAAAIPKARQYTFDGAGHTPQYTHLDELVRVEDFITASAAGDETRKMDP